MYKLKPTNFSELEVEILSFGGALFYNDITILNVYKNKLAVSGNEIIEIDVSNRDNSSIIKELSKSISNIEEDVNLDSFRDNILDSNQDKNQQVKQVVVLHNFDDLVNSNLDFSKALLDILIETKNHFIIFSDSLIVLIHIKDRKTSHKFNYVGGFTVFFNSEEFVGS